MQSAGVACARITLALGLAGVIGEPCRAGLVWTKTSAILDLASQPQDASVTFPFRNAGPDPVRIAMVLSSCDCVTAQLEKEVYAPGESGEILAVFKSEGASGRVERTIAVITAEAPTEPTILTLRIQLPKRIEVQPASLHWAQTSAPAEQVITLAFPPGQPAQIRDVHSEDPMFAVELDPASPPGMARVKVKPVRMTQPVRSTVWVTATFAQGTERIAIPVAVE